MVGGSSLDGQSSENLPAVLVVPGYQNSGPDHWQSRWERTHPDCRRAIQRDWDHPGCDEWVGALDRAIAGAGGPVVLVAHSLGCITVAHWSARQRGPIHAALLVAPCDVERPGFPAADGGFAPTPLGRLGFPSVVVASADDPYVTLERAREFAHHWGSRFLNIGPAGHINTAAGFGPWPEGEALLNALRTGRGDASLPNGARSAEEMRKPKGRSPGGGS